MYALYHHCMCHPGTASTQNAPSTKKPITNTPLLVPRATTPKRIETHQVILLSAVRSNRGGRVGFLSDWRRLNVAITRARRGVVVVGDPDTLMSDPHWRAFLRWCKARGAVMEESGLLVGDGSVAARQARECVAASIASGEATEGGSTGSTRVPVE